MDAPDWFLELEGKKTGPFSAQQIEALLRNGRLGPEDRATSDWLCGEWISVTDLINSQRSSGATAAAATAPLSASTAPAPLRTQARQQVVDFSPPPRPEEISQSPTGPVIIPEASRQKDPAEALYEVFQAARETKAHRHQGIFIATPPAEPTFLDRFFNQVSQLKPSHWARILTLFAAVLVGVFAVSKASRSKNAGENESSPPSTAPAAENQTRPKSLSAGKSAEELALELEKERLRAREKELEREREMARDRERERERERDRERERERERSLERERERSLEREREKERDRDRDREQERPQENLNTRERERNSPFESSFENSGLAPQPPVPRNPLPGFSTPGSVGFDDPSGAESSHGGGPRAPSPNGDFTNPFSIPAGNPGNSAGSDPSNDEPPAP